MAKDFEVIELEIDKDSLERLDARQRNQLVGCMHAHNELTVLNRLLMFSMNDFGDGKLHDSAHAVQMWCLLQVLVGKLFETWGMIEERFLKAQPEDPILKTLNDNQKKSLAWLQDYFGDGARKQNALRTIRDKAAFHYDKLNLTESVSNLATEDHKVYLAQHPANGLYFVGSALVFRTLFAGIADQQNPAGTLDNHEKRVQEGARITMRDTEIANVHMHKLMYGLIEPLMEIACGKPLIEMGQTRIPVVDAPRRDQIALPTFLNIGPKE